MAKQSGLGQYFFIDGYDLSTSVAAIDTCSGGHALLDVTSLPVSAFERITGLRDGSMGFSGWWDSASGTIITTVDALQNVSTDRQLAWYLGATVGDQVAVLNAKQIDFEMARGQDGGLGVKVTAQANGYGLDWGRMVTTGKQTFASAASGTTLDEGVDVGSTLFGATAYLQVFSLGSGTVDVKIQDSTNGSAWADVEGLAFTSATGQTFERKATTTSTTQVDRYLKVVLSNTFTAAVIAVAVCRYLVAAG